MRREDGALLAEWKDHELRAHMSSDGGVDIAVWNRSAATSTWRLSYAPDLELTELRHGVGDIAMGRVLHFGPAATLNLVAAMAAALVVTP